VLLRDKVDKDISPAGELVVRIGKGDLSAETELVKKYWRSLFFIINRRCNDNQLASDITQDAFIVVIAKARSGEINTPDAIAGFIRQTGVNLLIAHFRKETRRATDTHGEVSFEIPDDKSNVERAVESRDSLKLVQQLISEMKVERDKDLLISYYAKEEEKTSICKRLELTPAHFDRVLFRARSRLKQLIDFKLGDQNVSN
jgi:RNA polymerase sigma factor (sigma-70 family)